MTREGYNKYKELIDAWSRGATIEYYDFYTKAWVPVSDPVWHEDTQYRMKLYIPEQGDTIQVSVDGNKWTTGIFSEYKGEEYRVIATGDDEEWLITPHGFVVTVGYKYAKPLNK